MDGREKHWIGTNGRTLSMRLRNVIGCRTTEGEELMNPHQRQHQWNGNIPRPS
jgi:hypothetical protein